MLFIVVAMSPAIAAWAGYLGAKRGDDKKILFIAESVFMFNWICLMNLTGISNNSSTFEDKVIYILLLFGAPLIVYLLNKMKKIPGAAEERREEKIMKSKNK